MNAGASSPIRRTTLPAALGFAGWLGAGPLVATLLVGRTALFFPSLRWLATAVGAWLLLGAIGLLFTPVRSLRPEVRSQPAWGGRRGVGKGVPGGAPARIIDLATGLAPLAGLLPLLAVLYRDDASYHLTTSGPQAPARILAAYAFGLAAASSGAARLLRTSGHSGSADEPAMSRSEQPALAPAALLAGALAVAAMTALNLGWFGPLATSVPVHAPGVALVAGNLVALGSAAYLAAQAAGAAAPTAIVLCAAWLAFAPLSDALSGTAIGATLLVGALGLFVLARSAGRLQSAAGVALVFVALAFAWAAALAGGATTPPFWSAPHVRNAAAGALFSRLYAGPGALTAATAPPVAAAEALTAGTLAAFGLLTLWFVWLERPPAGARAVTATCLALEVALALWPTTPPSAAALAPLALVPFASPALWRGVAAGRRPGLAASIIAGYLLAGTSTAMLSKAATEFLSRWPALASLPALGLALWALALAFALRSHAACRPAAQ